MLCVSKASSWELFGIYGRKETVGYFSNRTEQDNGLQKPI